MATGQVALSRHRTPMHVPKSRPAVPAFLQKLHEMVNDPNNHELIRWSDAGDSFYVLDHERFAREVLGRWFKHQNFASFVRQLNMYGFHKIPHLQQGVLKSDNDTEFWNFEHQHFHRGQPELLCLIQRKKQAAQAGDEQGLDIPTTAAPTPAPAASGQVVDIQTVMSGIAAIQRHQSSITAELNELKRSNQLLWQDAMDAREKHTKQQDTINRIVKFLAGVFGNRTNPHKDGDVDSIPSHAVIPRRPTRFLIEDGRTDKVVMEDDEATRAFNNHLSDLYPIIETPHSAPSPAPSETPSTTSTYLGGQETTNGVTNSSTSAPSTHSSSSSSMSTLSPALVTEPRASAPGSGTEAPQPPDINERAVTPSRIAPPSPDFDPRVQVFLNQLTPAQMQQLLTSILPTESQDSSLPSTSSQITQYLPPSDFMSQFTPTQSLSSSVQLDNLLALDDDDYAHRVQTSWNDVNDIHASVDGLDENIKHLQALARHCLLPEDLEKEDTSPHFNTGAGGSVPVIPPSSLHPNAGTETNLAVTPDNVSDHASPLPSDLFDLEWPLPGMDGSASGGQTFNLDPMNFNATQLSRPLEPSQPTHTMGPPATQGLSPPTKRKLDLAGLLPPTVASEEVALVSPSESSSDAATDRGSKRRRK